MSNQVLIPEQTIRESRIVQSEQPDLSRQDLINIIKSILVVFAYAWWAVIVLYFGVLDSDASLYFKVLSFPIVWASFALCLVFQLSMKLNKNGFSSLFFIGLMVSGLLA
jgi:hypothetical protein